MTGNTLEVFINGILDMGGLGKEFIFRGELYFWRLCIYWKKIYWNCILMNGMEEDAKCLRAYRFWGKDF